MDTYLIFHFLSGPIGVWAIVAIFIVTKVRRDIRKVEMHKAELDQQLVEIADKLGIERPVPRFSEPPKPAQLPKAVARFRDGRTVVQTASAKAKEGSLRSDMHQPEHGVVRAQM